MIQQGLKEILRAAIPALLSIFLLVIWIAFFTLEWHIDAKG